MKSMEELVFIFIASFLSCFVSDIDVDETIIRISGYAIRLSREINKQPDYPNIQQNGYRKEWNNSLWDQ